MTYKLKTPGTCVNLHELLNILCLLLFNNLQYVTLCSGQKLTILLWEEHGHSIDQAKYKDTSKSHPIVAIFAGLIVKKMQGKHSFSF
jgi:hypothetical protein